VEGRAWAIGCIDDRYVSPSASFPELEIHQISLDLVVLHANGLFDTSLHLHFQNEADVQLGSPYPFFERLLEIY